MGFALKCKSFCSTAADVVSEKDKNVAPRILRFWLVDMPVIWLYILHVFNKHIPSIFGGLEKDQSYSYLSPSVKARLEERCPCHKVSVWREER